MPRPVIPGTMKTWLRNLPALLGLALLVGAIYVVQREFRHLRLRDIGAALHEMPPRTMALALGWTVLSYFVLTFYDRLGTIYAGHKVSYGRVAFASFCAYALSHNLGFATVSGAAVRYRLYSHWGLTPVQITKTVAFCSLTFGLGGMVLGGAILFLEPRAVPFFGTHLPRAAMPCRIGEAFLQAAIEGEVHGIAVARRQGADFHLLLSIGEGFVGESQRLLLHTSVLVCVNQIPIHGLNLVHRRNHL